MYYKKNFIIKRIKFTINVRIIVIMGLLDIKISIILTINFYEIEISQEKS